MKHMFVAILFLSLFLESCGKPSNGEANVISVEFISLNKTELSLTEGDSEMLEVTVLPEDAPNRTVTWVSSNSQVATVTKGEIAAITPGTATITAKAGDKQAQCQVTVQAFKFQAVDLGLSVKWGNANLGASKPEEFGSYYAWGETEEKSNYYWTNYKWAKTSSISTNDLTKYTKKDNKTHLEYADDVAFVKLGQEQGGALWRIPTLDDINKLHNNCSWTWTKRNGVEGYKVKSRKNGNSIFIPVGGGYIVGREVNQGLRGRPTGYYWSLNCDTTDPRKARYMHIDSENHSWSSIDRYFGLLVRPVCGF